MKKAFDVPKEWLDTRQRIQEKNRGPDSEKLIEERSKSLEQKIKAKPISKPGYFLRDLQKIMAYVEKMKTESADKKKRVDFMDAQDALIKDLRDLSNEVSHKKSEAELSLEVQKRILEQTKVLQDNELLSMISNLFNETYKMASIAAMLRKIAAIISQF